MSSYTQNVGSVEEPLVGIVSESETKKHKLRVLQVERGVPEEVSYRCDDLKSGRVVVSSSIFNTSSFIPLSTRFTFSICFRRDPLFVPIPLPQSSPYYHSLFKRPMLIRRCSVLESECGTVNHSNATGNNEYVKEKKGRDERVLCM